MTALMIPTMPRVSNCLIKFPTQKAKPTEYAVDTYELANHGNHQGARVKIVKMDRRFALYHEGFTHQIRGMNLNERFRVEEFFRTRYGDNRDLVERNGVSVLEYNRNWRLERSKRRFSGGTKIYIKHPHDLALLSLKFSEDILK